MVFIERYTHPTAEHTVDKSMCKEFTKADHTLSHKTWLNKFKKIAVIQSITSDHNGLKLEVIRYMENPQTFGN